MKKERILFQWMARLMWVLLLTASFSACEKTFLPEDEDWTDEDGGGFDSDESLLSAYTVHGDDIQLSSEPEVAADMLPFQEDKDKHEEMWDGFTILIPGERRASVKMYEVFHGGGEVLGYVYSNTGLDQWTLALDIYSSYPGGQFNGDGEYTYTTLHEYAHIMTLNHTQVDPTLNDAACDLYHTGEGCARPNAYIRAFWNNYWADIWAEYEAAQFDDAAMEDFDNQYSDRFVTSYASTSPEEDIAESFTAFVMQDAPVTRTSMASEKIAFFYDYPELVSLRSSIRAKLSQLPGANARSISRKVFPNRQHRCVRHAAID